MGHTSKIVPIDADHKVHILNVISRYHPIQEDLIRDHIDGPDKASLEMFGLYLMGNIEGRLLAGGELTEKDMEFIQCMEEVLNDADNDGV